MSKNLKVTILLPMSRDSSVGNIISQIAHLDMQKLKVDILIIADNPKITRPRVEELMRSCKVDQRYKLADVIPTNLIPVAEGNIARRRLRIAEVFNIAKQHIPEDSDLVFCVEDDTKLENNHFANLYQSWKTFKELKTPNGRKMNIKLGFISGIQVGRWGYRMIGVWKADEENWNTKKDPKILSTVPYNQNALYSKADAAGFYCFIIERNLFVESNFYANDFGPDVNFGLDLRRKGYINIIDWSVKTGHITPYATLYPEEGKVVVVKYEKKDGKWERTEP